MRKSGKVFQQEGDDRESRSEGGNSVGVEDQKSALEVFDYLMAASLKPSLLVFVTQHSSSSHVLPSFWFLWLQIDIHIRSVLFVILRCSAVC